MRQAATWLHDHYALPLIVIYRYDAATHELAYPITVGNSVTGLDERMRLSSSVYGSVASSRNAAFIESIPREMYFGATAEGMQVAYVIPLVHNGELLGVLCAQSDQADRLASSQRALLDEAAALIATKTAAAVRLANSEQAITRFDRFQLTAQRLTTRLESTYLLQEIVETAREMLDTQMSVLLNVVPDSDELQPVAWAGISDENAALLRSRLKGDLKGLVAWARKPARTADLHTDQRTASAAQAVAAGMESELAVPVLYSDKLYGVLAVETNVHRFFTDEEIRLLVSLAAHAGIALRNAQLYELSQDTNRKLEATVADLVISRQQAENARLLAVEANKFKTEFVNNMSHELRTPLNAVINFTRIVSEGHAGTVNDQQVQYLGFVHDSGQHLLGLINDILDLAKIELGKMELRREPAELEPILKGVMSTAVGLTRNRGLWLKQEIAPDLPTLNIDSIRIRQVLLNVLSNAAKFTQQGGITLRAEHHDNQVIVSVQDTGIGIAPENWPKVFEEFKQIENNVQTAEKGTGLGMPISRRFVQLHGGDMWLESTLGVGTTVFFSLPIDESIPELETFAL